MTLVSAPPISFVIVDKELALATAKVEVLQKKFPGADFSTFTSGRSVIEQLSSGAFDNPTILITANNVDHGGVELIQEVAGKAGFKAALLHAPENDDVTICDAELATSVQTIPTDVILSLHTDELLFEVLDAMIRSDADLEAAAKTAAE